MIETSIIWLHSDFTTSQINLDLADWDVFKRFEYWIAIALY